jgi:hypothetical protein
LIYKRNLTRWPTTPFCISLFRLKSNVVSKIYFLALSGIFFHISNLVFRIYFGLFSRLMCIFPRQNEIMLKNKSYLLRFDFNPRDISKGFFISNATKNSRWIYSPNLFKKQFIWNREKNMSVLKEKKQKVNVMRNIKL